MKVYLVMRDKSHEETICSIFMRRSKAEEYIKKQPNSNYLWIEEHKVII